MTLSIFLLYIMTVTALKPDDNHLAVRDSFDDLDGNAITNELIRVLFAYVRHVIHNGSKLLGIPRLDPFELEEYHVQIPAGPMNFNLQLKNNVVTGLGTFVVHRSHLTLPDLTFDMDISIQRIDFSTELYDLTGTLATTPPLPFCGNGKAKFILEGYRLRAKLYLKQSDDEKSLIINKIEGASFEIPFFESKIEGTVGDSELDPAVNAFVEELVTSYANRFSSAIANLGSTAFINFTNPILEQMNTWRFIAPFL